MKTYYFLRQNMLVIIVSYQQHSSLYLVWNGIKMKDLVTFALYIKIDLLKSIKSQIINTDMKSCIYQVSLFRYIPEFELLCFIICIEI